MPLRLSSADYQNLLEVARSTHDPRQLHRAQALLSNSNFGFPVAPRLLMEADFA